MGDFSCELCGGTHVKNTAEIRAFKIVSESGVSSGVRRIEALSGKSAINYLFQNLKENQTSRNLAGIQDHWSKYLENPTPLPEWIENKKSEIKNLEKEIKNLKKGAIDLNQLLKSAKPMKTIPSAQFLMVQIDAAEREILSETADRLRDHLRSGIIIVVGNAQGEHPIVVSITKDVTASFAAGVLLKKATQVMGGKGGGRPDFAQGSVIDLAQFSTAEKELSLFCCL